MKEQTKTLYLPLVCVGVSLSLVFGRGFVYYESHFSWRCHSLDSLDLLSFKNPMTYFWTKYNTVGSEKSVPSRVSDLFFFSKVSVKSCHERTRSHQNKIGSAALLSRQYMLCCYLEDQMKEKKSIDFTGKSEKEKQARRVGITAGTRIYTKSTVLGLSSLGSFCLEFQSSMILNSTWIL